MEFSSAGPSDAKLLIHLRPSTNKRDIRNWALEKTVTDEEETVSNERNNYNKNKRNPIKNIFNKK